MRLPFSTVLVVIDVQLAIDDPVWGPRNNPGAEARIAQLLSTWRQAGMPIVHIRHDSTEPRSPYRPGQPGHAFKPEARPLAGETVIAKETNSAFVGTGLEAHLEQLGATDLVMCGVITNNSLEASVRHAGNLGYRVFVPGDACWTVNKTDLTGRIWCAEDVHQLALANMHGAYATVTACARVCDAVAVTLARRRR
jgi:nicotinamidase-related amidase